MLEPTVERLGEGEILQIESGEIIFKLDSCEENPVVKPEDLGLTWYENGQLKTGAVFNGGAELFQDKVILTPRCHHHYRRKKFFDKKLGLERYGLENYISEIWPLVSEDGIHFTRFQDVVIRGDGADHQDFTYGIEDIRIFKDGREYLLIGCGKIQPPFKGANADRIAIYSTGDFVKITYRGMVDAFDSRNAVSFSEPVNGRDYILLRFHPNIHWDFLEAGRDQLLNPSQHRGCWKKIYERRVQNLLLEAGHYPHEKEKIGPSTQVVRTPRGWLLIYHAVGEIGDSICKAYGLEGKSERGYSICAALLDLDDPGKILCRTKTPLYIPSAPYELNGNEQYPVDVPAVVFPVGALVVKNRLIIYAGAGDKYIILLTGNLDKLIDYLWDYGKIIS